MAKKNTVVKKDDIQGKYIEAQVLRQQINALVGQKQQIDERLAELGATIDALKKLKELKKGEEMWSQIGSGTFVRSDIKDIERVLVAVGAGVVVSETAERASEILQSRVDDLESVGNEIVLQANSFLERIQQLEPELAAASKGEN